ncbi:MAG TPA: Rne/Rng family ribonuclease [candidate division Zixibacteria bacterium]|nr:Rne/Rng family ribonuclease [candidate division Zixibacteria bacterium]MDD4916744.1 Rne/Rng family ribonuclease [candidate division Zixibacteria bacterium]MDM7973815.1 Rne/Rng family ribonuclease [candidate division Zixibacteria bacterium]HOD65360.1 Rne/Rng family ribonuclease [candidate division Zixibacteria bacterium]HPM37984.1 Rne/Rng family ribonuclease [candidate division Zixibacteria bacterium]
MKKVILVNSTDYETRVALLEDERLVELQVERPDSDRMVGDIYKGIVRTVLPGMQAAFVDIGLPRAAYLHASDVGKDYDNRYDSEDIDEEEAPAEIIRKRKRETIEQVLKTGQEVLIQVIKEPISTKGPRISTEISIPGRYVVLVPDDDHIRMSKRITSWAEKRRLKKVLAPLRPEGFGLIVRTEAEGHDTPDFRADVKRVLKLWSKLKRKADTSKAPVLIHKEAEMIVSMIRDLFTDDVQRLIVDNKGDYKKVISYARQVVPHLKNRVELYKGQRPLFDQFNIEAEIERMMDRKVWIKKGAYIIIDQTEAMVTIDVNTGRFVGSSDQETTILQTNLLAAKEIARQIRLRDIGGLIICDFIDMYSKENRRKLYEEFKGCFRNDRAKGAINPVTDFGLVEMTRERVRPSHLQALSEPCPTCEGLGRILSKETMATKIERWFLRAKAEGRIREFNLALNPMLADAMSENGHSRIDRLMRINQFRINVVRDTTLSVQEYRVYDAQNNDNITERYRL